jgi:hypothetical protein
MSEAIHPLPQYVFKECAGITLRYINANHGNSSFCCFVFFLAHRSLTESEELTTNLKENSLLQTAKKEK